MLDGQIVNSRIIVDTTVAFTGVQRASKCGRELTNEAMVWKTKVSEFEGESDKMSDTNSMLVYATSMGKCSNAQVRSVDAAINEDCTIDIRVCDVGKR